MKLKAVAGLLQRNPFGVFVAKDGGIKTPKDLEGKTLLVTPGSPETPLLSAFFKRAGVDASKVKVVGVGAAAKVADYVAGKADAMITDVPYANPTLQPLRPSNVFLWADQGLVLPASGIFVQEEMLQKNPDLVRRFVQASIKGWDAAMKDIDGAAKALATARPGKADEGVIKAQLTVYRDFLQTERSKGKAFGWMEQGDWEEVLGFLTEYSGHKGSTNPADYFTNQFISK